MTFLTDLQPIRTLARVLRTAGYRIIVDGEHLTWKRWCPALEIELTGIRFTGDLPRMYRNPLKELVIDFDTTH